MDELERLGLEFCALEAEAIMKLCKLMTRRVGAQRAQLLEDAYHEALRVAPMAMRTWQPGRASLRTHVLGSMRWYIWKVISRAAKQPCEEVSPHAAVEGDQLQELFARDEVESILGRLPEAQAELLRWRFIHDMKPREIAELLDCTESKIYDYLKEALRAARETSR